MLFVRLYKKNYRTFKLSLIGIDKRKHIKLTYYYCTNLFLFRSFLNMLLFKT